MKTVHHPDLSFNQILYNHLTHTFTLTDFDELEPSIYGGTYPSEIAEHYRDQIRENERDGYGAQPKPEKPQYLDEKTRLFQFGMMILDMITREDNYSWKELGLISNIPTLSDIPNKSVKDDYLMVIEFIQPTKNNSDRIIRSIPLTQALSHYCDRREIPERARKLARLCQVCIREGSSDPTEKLKYTFNDLFSAVHDICGNIDQ